MRVIDGLILALWNRATWWAIGLVMGFMLCLTTCSASAAPPPRDTLFLQFATGSCSGTAISRHVILTASHCLDVESKTVTVSSRPANIVSVVADGKDHAFIRVDIEFKTWARLGPEPKQGDALRWIGNPAGNPNFYRQGYVANVGAFIFIDGNSFKGDSGAGLFNDRGQLVAVLSGAIVWTYTDHYRMQLSVARPLAFTREQWAATL